MIIAMLMPILVVLYLLWILNHNPVENLWRLFILKRQLRNNIRPLWERNLKNPYAHMDTIQIIGYKEGYVLYRDLFHTHSKSFENICSDWRPEDLATMSEATARAFKSGVRK
jgi:hypothetical protein